MPITLTPRFPPPRVKSRIFSLYLINIAFRVDSISSLEKKEVGFKSIQESIDTTSPGGRLIFHVFGALAEFERSMIKDRTLAGLAAARARGRLGGRPTKFTSAKLQMAQKLLSDKGVSVPDVCQTLQISKATLYRHLTK
jgi:DNA invertase Pin-like site-specific DNA recombinase